MKQKLFAFTLSIPLLLFAAVSFSQSGTPFTPGCTLPFDAIKKHHPIDSDCGAQGEPTTRNTAANNKQNEAKNNFCATGTITDMKTTDFVNLHKKVKQNQISYGSSTKVPEDRSGLQALGEGTLVRFTGYIIRAEYSNVEEGESVNCNEGGNSYNDMHIDLAAVKNDTTKCNRISAEISPHYRPKNWNKSVLSSVKSKGLKVRFTGQLFFDASHTACPDTGGMKLKRASSWEIHPVYQIEVFANHQWQALNDYVEFEE